MQYNRREIPENPLPPAKKRKQSNLRKRYQDELQNIWEWEPSRCCQRLCCIQLGTERCRYLRKEFLESSTMKRKEMLLKFRAGIDGDTAERIEIDGVAVCTAFQKIVLNISNTLRANILGQSSATATAFPGRIRGGHTSESKEIGIIVFLHKLADDVGDMMPHTSERHLPHHCKKLVLLQYFETERIHGRVPAKASTVYQTWKKHCPEIKCVRSHAFETCETCIKFKEDQLLMASGKLFGKTRASVLSAFSRHLAEVKRERAEYRRIREIASDRPGEVLSVIIDGADQAKFGLPRFNRKSKGDKGHALKQKVTGVLCHNGLGFADLFCIFTARDNIPGGANQTIDVFCRTLFSLIKRREVQDSLKTYPTELYFQLDNTAKDNKNRFFFAFCEHLVHLGIFKRISVNFLPVGHTHEDIDRKFSRISVKLSQQDTVSVADLHEAMRTSEQCTVLPLVTRVQSHLNYSSCIVKQKRVVRNGHGITLYRKFVFERMIQIQGTFSKYKVMCKAGLTMTTPLQSLVLLERDAESIGCFLLSVPDTANIPETMLKRITISEATEFRSRIRSTENRIRSQRKCQELMKEVDIMEHVRTAHSEWDFEELIRMQGCADRLEDCEAESDVELADDLSYETGEMVTVRSSTGSSSVTPFWLGSIVEAKSNLSAKILVVHWYTRKEGIIPNQGDSDVCFKAKYEPCNPNLRSSYDEIPAQSVYCCFESLTLNGSIPIRAQHQTRQAMADITEEAYGNTSEVSKHVDALVHNTGALRDVDNEAVNGSNEADLGRRIAHRPSLNVESMAIVRCPEETVPFWVGKVVCFQSANHLRFKVQWYKTTNEQTDSDERYLLSAFVVDNECPKTTISVDNVIASFKSLTRNRRIPKKVIRETLKNK